MKILLVLLSLVVNSNLSFADTQQQTDNHLVNKIINKKIDETSSKQMDEALRFSTDTLFNAEVWDKVKATNDLKKIEAYKLMYINQHMCISKGNPELYKQILNAQEILGGLYIEHANNKCCRHYIGGTSACEFKDGYHCAQVGYYGCAGNRCP